MVHAPSQRSLFSVIHLALITVASFLIADITVLLVADRLEQPVLPADSALSTDAREEPTPRPPLLLTSVLERGVFGRRAGRPDRTSGEDRRLSLNSLQVRLVGTVVGDPSYPFAILENLVTREQVLYRLHDHIPGMGQIVKIARNTVTIASGQARRILESSLDEDSAHVKPAEPLAAVDPLGARRLVLDRRELSAGFENLADLMTKARVYPHVAYGKPEGFVMRDIVPGSLFARIGLRNNDILRRINGVEMKDPETLFKVFLGLKDETSISLDVLRAGQMETYAYEIR